MRHFRSRSAILLVLVSAAWCYRASAQTDDPFSIQVESSLVLVRAHVFYKNPTSQMWADHQACYDESHYRILRFPFSEPYVPPDCDKMLEINDLPTKDFRVFDDGVEQKVERVVVAPDHRIIERDIWNDASTFHENWSYTPRGMWSASDTSLAAGELDHYYRITYIPTKRQPGACHHIQVLVDRPDADVRATDQYCYVEHPATDPLEGRDFGRRLEAELNSDASPQIPLSAQAGAFYSGSDTSTVELVLEFPFEKLNYSWVRYDFHASIGVLGTLSTSAGRVVERFSDFALGAGDRPHEETYSDQDRDAWLRAFTPCRYETQVDVPPGDYVLRVILSDGQKFGRVTIPVHVEEYKANQLALSSLFIFRRYRFAAVSAQERARVNLAPDYKPLVSEDIEITPTAHLAFKDKDLLPTYFEVYEPSPPQSGVTVQARMRIVDAVTGKVVDDLEWFDAARYRREGDNVFAITKTIPLKKLKKGDYLVEAMAKDSAGRTSNWESTAFTVE